MIFKQIIVTKIGLIFFCLLCTDKDDCLKPIAPLLWAQCMQEKSIPAPPLCPLEFKENAEYFLNALYGLTLPDVTHQNCKEVYLKLVNIVNYLLP